MIVDPLLIDTTRSGLPISEITLRDIFAGLIVAGYTAHPCCLSHGQYTLDESIVLAYKAADKMLAERTKR